MRFYAYSPLARGVLTGKFTTADDENVNRLQANYMSPAMHAALTELTGVCMDNGVELKDAALRW